MTNGIFSAMAEPRATAGAGPLVGGAGIAVPSRDGLSQLVPCDRYLEEVTGIRRPG